MTTTILANGTRVETAPHITGEDADAGRILEVRTTARGVEYSVAWDSGTRTWTPAGDVVAA